jgi:hypothetical protein
MRVDPRVYADRREVPKYRLAEVSLYLGKKKAQNKGIIYMISHPNPSLLLSSVSVRGAFEPSFWVLACNGARRLLLRPESWERHSRDYLRIGDAFPGHGVHEGVKASIGVNGDVTSVQPKSGFIDIPAKVLRADVVPYAMHTPFENRPYGLNRVRVSRSISVLPDGMVYSVMPVEQPIKAIKKGIIYVSTII